MADDPRPCRYCGAPIVWVPMANGSRMPCDAELLTVIVFRPSDDGRGSTLRAHQPHWASCPRAGEAREDAKKRRA